MIAYIKLPFCPKLTGAKSNAVTITTGPLSQTRKGGISPILCGFCQQSKTKNTDMLRLTHIASAFCRRWNRRVRLQKSYRTPLPAVRIWSQWLSRRRYFRQVVLNCTRPCGAKHLKYPLNFCCGFVIKYLVPTNSPSSGFTFHTG